MDAQTLQQLASETPWLQYAIHTHLLQSPKEVTAALLPAVLACPEIQTCLLDVAAYHSTPVTSHKNAVLPIYKLLFLLDLGLEPHIPEIQTAIDTLCKHADTHGVYQSVINTPTHFGGTGKNQFGWSLCDAPLLLLALLKAGVDYTAHIQPGVDYLVSFSRDNGFPCTVSPELGTFRGPGKKADCCPLATLLMVNLLSRIPEYRDSAAVHHAVEALLSLWENSRTQHPYLFYMGTDFRKLKAPSIWYDLLTVTSVLSQYPWTQLDPRFLEMLALLQSKQDEHGLLTSESIYLGWKGWDFGQKKAPSLYLTYLYMLIQKRCNQG